MNIRSLFFLILTCALSSNFTLVYYFNTDALIHNSGRPMRRNIRFTMYLCLVFIVAIFLVWPVELLLIRGKADYLRVLVYEIFILASVNIVSLIFPRDRQDIYSTALSSGLLGSALLFQRTEFTFIQTVFAAIGVSLGFLIVSVALESVNERVKDEYVAPHFKGYPIMLVSLAIISLAVYAF